MGHPVQGGREKSKPLVLELQGARGQGPSVLRHSEKMGPREDRLIIIIIINGFI